ncbi:hypothetical protein B0J18DRAFT_467597 [Chaetomium sp. MPI-SDFR-AT-0129]|nr:hypothetical protein B0J18DRAFT_467597 [Chaetomium sp. MPI-SDFR-AT-0129]
MPSSSSTASSWNGSKPESKGKEKASTNTGSSKSSKGSIGSILSKDRYASSLSNHTGLERWKNESANDAAWNPFGASSGR